MDSICAAVARRGGMKILAAPLLFLICLRLRRIKLRFIRYATLPPPRPRASRPAAKRPLRPPPPLSLPRCKAWLLLLVPETAQLAPQIEHFLGQPDVEALIATNPQYARMLRPLCRMLKIRLPPALRPPAPPKAAPPEEAASAPPPDAAPAEPSIIFQTPPAPASPPAAPPRSSGPPLFATA